MAKPKKSITRRDFILGSSAAFVTFATIEAGCDVFEKNREVNYKHLQSINTDNSDPLSWWHKKDFIIHETVDTSKIDRGVIRAFVDGVWQEFKLINLPKEFVEWSIDSRINRLNRMLRYGGMDLRDLAGAHNACVATYGGPSRDSSISINTAYKGMGFTIRQKKLADTTQRIKEEKFKIERDSRGDISKQMHNKVKFLAKFYQDASSFDLTKQVSLELFTSASFHTHTFLNMMVNPITSASFLAFPTFEIRAIPQLLHPKNPNLSQTEKDLIEYTNCIHDFIHSGYGKRITCVYHIIELFNDTPNDNDMGRRVA